MGEVRVGISTHSPVYSSYEFPPTVTLAASILSADFLHLERDCRAALEAGCEWLHVDVMDGQFVPNLTFGLPIVRALRPLADEFGALIDVHLMIEDPERQATAYAEAGADLVTVHWEACTHPHRVLQQIREAGARPGMALNPGTPAAVLEDVIPDLDLLLVMSVNPGFAGQAFIESSPAKIEKAAQLVRARSGGTLLSVDGGVRPSGARQLLEAGAHVLVAASAIFEGDIATNVDAFHTSAREVV